MAKRNVKARDVTIKVDAALKKRYDKLAHELDQAKRKGSSAFDALWEAVAAIVEHRPPLYLVGGYDSDTHFFRERLGESRRNAYRYMRVAKFASPRDETKHGTTKIDAALGYLEAKLGAPLAHPPLPVAFDRLKIPVDRDDRKRLPFGEARVEDVIAATRALRKTDRKPKHRLERELGKALARERSLKSVRVHVRGDAVSFSGVPAAELGRLAEILATLKWRPEVP